MTEAKQKWVILDRDGVINHDSDAYIKSPEEWRLIEGSDTAIAKLNQLGYKVAVITNQSGIARAYFTLEALNQINQKMHDAVTKAGGHIDAVYFCPHGPGDHCECRKPLSGLFRQFSTEHQVDLSTCYAIGDSVRDLEAAQSCECNPILVETGKGPRSLASIAAKPEGHWLQSVPVFANLNAFTDSLSA